VGENERSLKDLYIGESLLLTVEEAAALLRIGRTTTFELVMRGQLESVRIGRRRLVVREGLQRYIAGLLIEQMELSDL
jgi:excisionase family DNA binding protein